MAGQSAAHTSAALSALASDVSSQTNDTSAATLSADVDQTVNMMNAEAKTAAENDNATLAGIQSQYEQNMNSVNAQVHGCFFDGRWDPEWVGDWSNFGGLVLGYIDASGSEIRRIVQILSRSTRFAHFTPLQAQKFSESTFSVFFRFYFAKLQKK